MNENTLTKADLMKYSKEELALYIFDNCWHEAVMNEMENIHTRFLIDKDLELKKKARNEEEKLYNKWSKMQLRTEKDCIEYEKILKKWEELCYRNDRARKKRQAEINKLLELQDEQEK